MSQAVEASSEGLKADALREPSEELTILEPTTKEYFGREKLGQCVVVGAAGYLGQHLTWVLANMVGLGLVDAVHAVDIRQIPQWLSDRSEVSGYVVKPFAGDGMENHLRPILSRLRGGTMFFVAATSSRELSRTKLRQGNYDSVVQALGFARRAYMGAFILTSSHNVVFDGVHVWHRSTEMEVRTTLTRAPRHMDYYSRTKYEGEVAVLAANGSQGVRTCAIRPNGIFGPFEEFHFNRAKSLSEMGLNMFRIGREPRKGMDWNYISNIVDAHILAAQRLMEESRSVSTSSQVSGRAFFVVDGPPPDSTQDFWAPVLEAAGHSLPRTRVSVPPMVMYFAAILFEVVGHLFGAKPFLMRMEVQKVITEHTFNSDAAAEAFQWTPRVSLEEGLRRCVVAQARLRAVSASSGAPHKATS